ncbi:DUF1657 domain-containing protein [Serpentinicella alkaliphila]|uniref:Uncharacterized protein DUF1657 n=1 Tax=Serpentinicella alkaliphila TaxID=1734049 RepID=A0A4R2TK07_9FIRM|nr:DUF1657 domain-containing protein [Serpentinicella alkaliphila]QUH27020.1 DUF1657 domain-containing protein [Serpentinicella alkaliphila]TCQ01515.1 uncharacterized protein DUF1657 [Serpentinicella alkaliphila]
MTVGMKVKKTIADLKGTNATLKLYSIQSGPKESKDTYMEASKLLDEIILDLEKRLKVLEFEEPQYKGF